MTVYTLSSSWIKVASAGQYVELQNLSFDTAYLSTSSTGSAPTDGGALLLTRAHGPVGLNLTQDLWAQSGLDPVMLTVMIGFAQPASGSSPAASPASANFSQASNSALVAAVAA